MQKEIRKISLASIFSALCVAFIILGGVFEILDMTLSALCSVITYISIFEIKGKYPLLIFLTSSVISLILSPLTTATLYYVFFFGYYPILKFKLSKLGKIKTIIICTIIFNIVMFSLMMIFKTVFALQNEPVSMYVILLITLNIFFLCFDGCMNAFLYIYVKKIRPKINFRL